MTALRWPDLLDALEERNRRFAALVNGGTSPVPEVPLRADGPLPAELTLRAEAVLAETERLAALAELRRDRSRRSLHYSRV